MLRKLLLASMMLMFASCFVQAQDFLNPTFTFSSKKASYVTLVDGTVIKGELKDLDRKKGLISEVKIKDENGKKHTFKPNKVQSMYLVPSGLDKMSKGLSFASDVKQWNNTNLNQEYIKEGYVYFEQAKVKIKKKERVLLLQLLNPAYSKDVKVYFDPFAKKSASVGVGGLKLAGGIAKSYYVSKDGGVASKLTSKDYTKTEFKNFWSDCAKVKSKYPKVKWADLGKHIRTYSECK